MLWAQRYAYAQREAMMDSLMEAVSREVGSDWQRGAAHQLPPQLRRAASATAGWITRKGAIDACEGKMGIIPGSMGAATYIVRGRGNADAYNTSPHGAGRVMGRKQARKTLTHGRVPQADGRQDLARPRRQEAPRRGARPPTSRSSRSSRTPQT